MKLHRPIVGQIPSALHDTFVSGYYADKVIEYYFKRHKSWGRRDRGFFAEAMYDIVRWYRTLHYALDWPWKDGCGAKYGEDRFELLLFAWLVFRGYEPPEWLDSYKVEPILKQLENLGQQQLGVRESYPKWLDILASSELGDLWGEAAVELNKPGPLFLRTNSLKSSGDKLVADLASEEIEAEVFRQENGTDTLVLPERRNVFRTEAFKHGLFEVQDANSQLIAPFLQVKPGMRVIDACAGAGGKTLHLAALMKNKGKIIAMDVHQRKLQELKKRVARAGVDNVEVRQIEGQKVIKRLDKKADRLLLDVPCSGLGVIRRNPDSKWKLSEAEIGRLNALQQEILSGYARMVAVNGKLVYATCSILPSENRKQVDLFLSQNENSWEVEEDMNVLPREDQGDGFYMARLRRLN